LSSDPEPDPNRLSISAGQPLQFGLRFDQTVAHAGLSLSAAAII
jgi:hypothetical protein